MTERPILFNGDMVRAILAGQKTQTRRVVKPQPSHGPVGQMVSLGDSDWAMDDGDLSGLWRCPYGQPGDRLWVRETWADLRGGGFGKDAAYRADSLTKYGEEDGDSKRCRLDYGSRWRPSIHMPRWASRLTLEVTGVRVERLQDISEADARAEGCNPYVPGEGVVDRPRFPDEYSYRPDYRSGFAMLWDSLYRESATWDANPWVWVVSFRRIGGAA